MVAPHGCMTAYFTHLQAVARLGKCRDWRPERHHCLSQSAKHIMMSDSPADCCLLVTKRAMHMGKQHFAQSAAHSAEECMLTEYLEIMHATYIKRAFSNEVTPTFL